MNDNLLRLYHSLPGPARSMAASLRGYYLRSWRYGLETEEVAREALQREHWDAAHWQQWQEERLAYVLQRAALRTPFYRDLWRQREQQAGPVFWNRLDNWPLLSKERLRENPQAFVADDCRTKDMLKEQTSGTSGKPITVWQTRQTARKWYALNEARVRGWNGVGRADRWAIVGGQLIVPFERQRPPFWVWNAGMSQLYLSSYHLSPGNVPAYVRALKQYEVVYLVGYASSLYSLAQAIVEQNLQPPSLQVVISNAEPLYDHQRATIAQAFQCPVRDTYGMSEIVCGASECEEGKMHIWPEAGIIEIIQDDRDEPVEKGQVGRIVCTGLLNSDMPLIRYEVGDRGAVVAEDNGCACGRTLPVLQKIEGRLDDVIITRDGRRIGRLDPVFKADLLIREAQIIQKSLDHIHVRLVPAPGNDKKSCAVIAKRLQDRVGDAEITFEYVDAIPRSSNGKFRSVISEIKNP